MADYVFKVQVILPGNVETVILRQYIDPVDRCFDRFKTNLVQRFDALTNSSFKMMWIDNDGDKISIFNEEDLRTFMELKGTKIFVEVDGASTPTADRKPVVDNRIPIARAPIFRSCRRNERGWILGDGRYQAQNAEINGNNVNAQTSTATGSSPPVVHLGVVCDGCDCEIRGYRYKCIECPDFDLCFTCETKKLHGDHMMIRIVKPLDRPFNRHFFKHMMKQRCLFRDSFETKDKDKRSRHRHDNPTFIAFDDIMTDIAKNISTHCTVQPSNEGNKDAGAKKEKADPIDPKQQFALNSETFAKAGEVLSNLAQHFVSVMDPFAVHEFIPTTPTSGNQNETNKKPTDPQSAANENEDTIHSSATPPSNVPATPVPADVPKDQAIVDTPLSDASAVPAATVPDQRVTIEDIVDVPSAPRDSSPIPDWALVDSHGHIEESDHQPKHTGAIPKTSAVPTPNSVGSVDSAAALPNYAVLARDLEDHLHQTLKSQASQTPPQMPFTMPIVHHPNPKINEAIITMTSMGFSNGGGWLTRLLENVNGDIPKALEKLHPSQ